MTLTHAENNQIYSAVESYGVNEVYHAYTTEDETDEGVAAAMICCCTLPGTTS